MRHTICILLIAVPLITRSQTTTHQRVAADGTLLQFHGDNIVSHVLTNQVKCPAFKKDFHFREGSHTALAGLPHEAFYRLVAVQGERVWWLSSTTTLVNFVAIATDQEALAFVRLFSQRSTSYLFDDSRFRELSLDTSIGPAQFDMAAARAAGVPVDSLPVHIGRSDGAFIVTRYVVDCGDSTSPFTYNILKVSERVTTNGGYEVVRQQQVATNIVVILPIPL